MNEAVSVAEAMEEIRYWTLRCKLEFGIVLTLGKDKRFGGKWQLYNSSTCSMFLSPDLKEVAAVAQDDYWAARRAKKNGLEDLA